jgi:hypothetical protein
MITKKADLILFEGKWYLKDKMVWYVFIEEKNDWVVIEQVEVH